MVDIFKRYELYQRIISSQLIGFERIAECLLISLVIRGHILLEGPPGVAKTMLAKIFASLVNAGFKRIQFTPDLLPADVIGTVIYNPGSGKFNTRLGPIFTNIILADEINRASPKTQSALLEAMEERQITIEGKTFFLEEPFMILATQNPVEQEGTYPLPEAQLDRFLMKITINYPSEENETKILEMKFKSDISKEVQKLFSRHEIIEMNRQLKDVYISENIMKFASAIITHLRKNSSIVWGPSPRASISIINVGKVLAILDGRDYVVPRDITKYLDWILNHRIGLSPEYELEGTTTESIVKKVFEEIDAI